MDRRDVRVILTLAAIPVGIGAGAFALLNAVTVSYLGFYLASHLFGGVLFWAAYAAATGWTLYVLYVLDTERI